MWPSISERGEERETFEKFVPIFKSKDERIVCGIVYEPDTEDAQGDSASAEEIEKAANEFMENIQKFKVNHKGKSAKIKVLQSYIAPQDLEIGGQSIKKGSWVLSVRILDDDIWEEVKSGELTGFSMAGTAKSA
jgi:hypothetical protein